MNSVAKHMVKGPADNSSLGKYRIGQPGDALELEADRIADEVLRMPEAVGTNFAAGTIPLQRKCAACEAGGSPCPACSLSAQASVSQAQGQLQQKPIQEEGLRRQPIEEEEEGLSRQPIEAEEDELQLEPLEEADEELQLQRQSSAAAQSAVGGSPKSVEAVRSGGEPLPNMVRDYFEPRFGADLGGVRVHTGETAARATAAVNARAFTLGNSIAFAPGQFDPSGVRGRRLLAHELTHTIQQTHFVPIRQTCARKVTGPSGPRLRSGLRLQRWGIDENTPRETRERADSEKTSESASPDESSDIESTAESSAHKSHVTTARAWLVSNPAEWEQSHVATLNVGVAIDVIDLGTASSFNRCDEEFQWWQVEVLNGPEVGRVDWVMRVFLKEDRIQPRDVEVWRAVERLAAAGKHWEAIDVVILEYTIPIPDRGDVIFRYDPNLSVAGNADGSVDPMIVRIGPSAFASLPRLARVIVHELEHIRQFQEGIDSGGHEYDLGQFLSECAEMTATGMPEYSFAEFMDTAHMAMRFWYALAQTSEGLDQQEQYWDTFVDAREVIRARYAEADPDSRTSEHDDTMGWFNAQKHPGPPPLP